MHPNDINLAALAGLVAFALCALPPVARAGEQHLTCPASVDGSQVQARDGGTGPVGTLQFRGAAEAIFAVGPLQDAAWGELKDPPTTKKGDAVIVKYPLPAGDSDKYVICYYGERFYKALKLPAATKECDVVHSPDRKAAKGRKATYGISDIICR